MTHPPAQSEPPDAAPALSRTRPGFARRLGGGHEGLSQSALPPALPFGRDAPRPPFLKRVERYVSAVLKLGSTYGAMKRMTKHLGGQEARMAATVAELRGRQDDMEGRLHGLEFGGEGREATSASDERLDALADDLDRRVAEAGGRTAKAVDRLRTQIDEAVGEVRHRLARDDEERAGLSRAYSDLSRRLDGVRAGRSPLPAPAPEMTGLDALMESFYVRLEDRYRGSREEIAKRLVQYLPDTEAAVDRTGRPVLDLGCGRGEWLQLLRSRSIEGTGVDLNEMQLREARDLGLDVHLGDACRFLADAPDDSYAMVTAHHLAEHLPFKTLAWMTREILRVLAPGGIVLYETPNIGNILVGASSFHIDPTHVRPLPAAVLTTLFDTIGFHPVESRSLHPSPTYEKLVRDERLDPVVAHLLFGPQDLAVLGTKPDGAA